MIYLDNSATSDNKPHSVKKAVLKALDNSVNVGRNSSSDAFKVGKSVYNVREKTAEFIGIDNPENIIFTNNASMSLNMAFKGLLDDNSHIITTFFEHNSVLRQIYGNKKITCTHLPANENFITDIEKISEYISDKTSAVIVNCASNVTGVTVNYKRVYEICSLYNLPIIFDFSQYVGNKDINLAGMKKVVAAFSGHKALLGPQGVGVMYVSDDLELKTVIEGGTGSLSEELKQPDYLPDRFEVGTINTPGILGLGAGIDFLNSNNKKEISEYKMSLVKRLYEGLSDIKNISIYHDGSFDNKVPLISFNIEGLYSEQTAMLLSKNYKISVRGGFHCAPYAHKIIGTHDTGAVRLSPGYKTKRKEIEKTLYAVKKIAETKMG